MDVLQGLGLETHSGLMEASDRAFPTLVLLALLARRALGRPETDLPNLRTAADCLDLLGQA